MKNEEGRALPHEFYHFNLFTSSTLSLCLFLFVFGQCFLFFVFSSSSSFCFSAETCLTQGTPRRWSATRAWQPSLVPSTPSLSRTSFLPPAPVSLGLGTRCTDACSLQHYDHPHTFCRLSTIFISCRTAHFEGGNIFFFNLFDSFSFCFFSLTPQTTATFTSTTLTQESTSLSPCCSQKPKYKKSKKERKGRKGEKKEKKEKWRNEGEKGSFWFQTKPRSRRICNGWETFFSIFLFPMTLCGYFPPFSFVLAGTNSWGTRARCMPLHARLAG